MNSFAQLATALRAQHQLGESFLQVLEREHQALRRPEPGSPFEFYQERKNLLPRLEQSLGVLKEQRRVWDRLAPAEREQYPDIGGLLRSNQDLLMKLILLDRENEQTLLRHGLVPPNHLPAANRQRPHFVADLYRRHRHP